MAAPQPVLARTARASYKAALAACGLVLLLTALKPLIPQGYRLNKEELRGVTENERTTEAPKFDLTGIQTGSNLALHAETMSGPAKKTSEPPAPNDGGDEPSEGRAATNSAMSHTTAPTPAKSRSTVRLAAIALGVALLVVVGWKLMDRQGDTVASHPPAVVPSATATAAAGNHGPTSPC